MGIVPSVRSFFFVLVLLVLPASSFAGIILSIGFEPPPLPVYEQPFCPGDGYIWTPGYWAYSDDGGYFWVPGTWVLVPEPGFLWTPAWWGWDGALFVFHEGYWGPLVGFYGGINYGFGYGGVGYEGGYWRDRVFFYNRSVNNVTNVTNVYNKTVIINTTVRNVSYNGGAGGIEARPTAQEEAAARERHLPPISTQTQHRERASTNRDLFESTNHGRPAIAATAKPAEFNGPGVVAARASGPSYREPAARSVSPGSGSAPRPESRTAVHPNELPPIERSTPNTGNPTLNQRYQQTQDQLRARQEQQRQNLQQKQEQEHQRLDQRKASDAEKQSVEQRHQQQTQQLTQKHSQEQQKLQQKQPERKPEQKR
jgi:hypothetical protein